MPSSGPLRRLISEKRSQKERKGVPKCATMHRNPRSVPKWAQRARRGPIAPSQSPKSAREKKMMGSDAPTNEKRARVVLEGKKRNPRGRLKLPLFPRSAVGEAGGHLSPVERWRKGGVWAREGRLGRAIPLRVNHDARGRRRVSWTRPAVGFAQAVVVGTDVCAAVFAATGSDATEQ